ncbi:hypothetical protein [Salinirubrum litoreum]|uniref:CHAT domain-containing protein n=1 Tax=Salinirubrum litoreum TaxID=1126234 RepID=A0ABD5R6S4_9EURY|nr:hypothetical protein [Salinirubrum litoreum]
MIEVKPAESGVKAVDVGKNTITVGVDDWRADGTATSVNHPVEKTITATTTHLQFPHVYAYVERVSGDVVAEPSRENDPTTVESGDYVFCADGNVKTFVRFSGPAEISSPRYDTLLVTFPSATEVTIGFQSRVSVPQETITVPSTPSGLATALTHLPSFETETPDRTFPSMRRHPARVETGESVSIPESLVSDRLDTGVTIRTPRSFDCLFPVASLAHYLGATVTVEDRQSVVVETPTREHELATTELGRESADLLSRVFFLDCLVRSAGPYGSEPAEAGLLDDVGIDPDRWYDAGLAARLGRYLDAPFERVIDELPTWHLAMYVDPRPAYVEVLPFLLHNLPTIYLAESEPLEQNERLSRSLDDFYRRRRQVSDPPSVEVIKPNLAAGRMHGWLADGAPIDVFKSIPTAYENRFDYLGRSTDSISVVAVLNDPEMSDEHADAADIYRKRAEELDIDISVREHLTREELADVFEASHDFVHYIGHCEADGLRCADGNLAVSSLSESNTQVFFLNACGSFNEGVELVEQGSVAGAVTFNKVLDSQAARVGTAFARLLIHGFSIEYALQLARRRIMMGKDYTVVGDGTHRLTQSNEVAPSRAVLERRSDGRFSLEYDVYSPEFFGSNYRCKDLGTDHDEARLLGNPTETVVTADELVGFLETADTAVIYDGDIHWSADLRHHFDKE